MDNLVSVIIPSYNRFQFLNNALDSVMDQTYQNFEIIIINDGSTENEYYESSFEERIKLIHLKENQTRLNGFGPGSIRNFGINEAKGKYIAFLDDDDLWLPNKLDLQVKALEGSSHKMSSTEGYFGKGVYEKNKKYPKYNSEHFIKVLKKIYKKSDYLKKGSFPEIWDLEFLKIHNCMITSSVMVEKELLDTLGRFRGIPGSEDYDCWLGLLHHTNSVYINEPLFYYDSNHGDGVKYF